MDSLKELAGREMAVLQRAHAAVGLIEEKEVLLREAGVYSASASIHAAYIALTAPPESNPEALKRAVFLGWYDDAEPGWITGVEDLPSDQVRQALELLDSARLGGRIDGEFAAMLGWFWSVADWHFEAYASDGLVAHVSALDPKAWRDFNFSRESLEGRGQMADYWISIVRPSA